jgi:hypothetical protein
MYKYILFIFFLLNCNVSKVDNSSQSALLLLLNPLSNSTQNTPSGSCTTTQVGNEFETTVNATSQTNWTHCSISSGGILLLEKENWDIRFQRFKIATNSGTSGKGLSGACNTNLDSISSINKTTCITKIDVQLNQEGGGSGGSGSTSWSGAPDFLDWYSYTNTILTPKNRYYLIKSVDGKRIFALRMIDYYSQAGTSGYPKFRWKEL